MGVGAGAEGGAVIARPDAAELRVTVHDRTRRPDYALRVIAFVGWIIVVGIGIAAPFVG